MLKVYGDIGSGNCYKLKLLLHLLDVPCEWVHVDILRKETRTPEYLAKNPNGKIPAVELGDGEFLWESNAILYYLGNGTDFLPDDRLHRARVMQWLFFEQYSHEPYIATSRFIVKYLGSPDDRMADLVAKQPGGYKALGIMEQQLESQDFLAANRFSIADIALFAYTHVANEGGFDLTEFVAIGSWLERIQARPRFVPMRSPSA